LPGLKKARRDHKWLGMDRERAVAHLQDAMAATDDGQQKVRLAREARKVRHGRDIVREPDAFTFPLNFADLNNPIIRIGVH